MMRIWRRLALVCLVPAALAALGLGVLFAIQQDRDVNTVIEIAAPPARVWAVLADTRRYPDWNPLIASIAGPLRTGAVIEVTLRLPAGTTRVVRPRLLAVEPGYEIRWLGDLAIPRLFTVKHKLIMTPAGPGRTRLRHEAEFRGLLVGPLADGLLAATERGFRAMNRALKARVEAAAG